MLQDHEWVMMKFVCVYEAHTSCLRYIQFRTRMLSEQVSDSQTEVSIWSKLFLIPFGHSTDILEHIGHLWTNLDNEALFAGKLLGIMQ